MEHVEFISNSLKFKFKCAVNKISLLTLKAEIRTKKMNGAKNSGD